jgi:hypothetical protein
MDHKRSVVIVNQAANYLTIDLANEFSNRFDQVFLITGGIHEQSERLSTNVKIEWINRYKSKNTVVKAWSYLVAYCFILFKLLTRFRKEEVLFVSIPPMSYLLGLFLQNRISILVWDVYPDVMRVAGLSGKSIMYRILSRLNRMVFNRAHKIFTIGEVMSDLLAQYVSQEKIIIQPIWSIFQFNARIGKNENPFIEENRLKGKFIVQYSGNVGLTHRVELLIELADRLKQEEHIFFQIIGKGSRMQVLRKMVDDKRLENCQIMPFQSDDMFPYSLSAADLGVVILDEDASRGSVPSKSYNLMMFGIPALYITAEDSELSNYSRRYKHADSYTETQLDNAAAFIVRLSKSEILWKHYSLNAIRASMDFQRDNARKIVDKYLF